MNALEIISGSSAVALTDLTICTGDNLKLRQDSGLEARILSMWGSDGAVRIYHPFFGVSGFVGIAPAGSLVKFFDEENSVKIANGETLKVTCVTPFDSRCYWSALVYYPDREGRFITYEEFTRRKKLPFNLQLSLTGSATDYGTGVAFKSGTNAFTYQDTDYALLGALPTTTFVQAIRIIGIDTGNLGLGFPLSNALGNAMGVDQYFFLRLAYKTGLACIPVFNSTNDGNTIASAFGTTDTVNVVLQFSELEK